MYYTIKIRIKVSLQLPKYDTMKSVFYIIFEYYPTPPEKQ